MTIDIPAPDVIVEAPYCPICREMYATGETDKSERCVAIIPPPTDRSEVKINSRVLSRCLTPVLGIFFGLPKAKAFKRACHLLGRDWAVRNCGPAFILRKAMKSVPSYMLDDDFLKTEDLVDVPIHASPSSESDCCIPVANR